MRAEHGKPGFLNVKGGALGWQNWRSGEPNDLDGDEDCVNIFGDGLWNDIRCSDEFKAVCQINKSKYIFFSVLDKTS